MRACLTRHKSNRMDQISFSNFRGCSRFWAMCTFRAPQLYLLSAACITYSLRNRLHFAYAPAHQIPFPFQLFFFFVQHQFDTDQPTVTKGYGEYLVDFFSSFMLEIKSILLLKTLFTSSPWHIKLIVISFKRNHTKYEIEMCSIHGEKWQMLKNETSNIKKERKTFLWVLENIALAMSFQWAITTTATHIHKLDWDLKSG